MNGQKDSSTAEEVDLLQVEEGGVQRGARGGQPLHTCITTGIPAYTQEHAQPRTWGQRGTGG